MPGTQEAEVAEGRSRYRWWILASAVLVNLIGGSGWNYIIMVVPQVLEDLGLEIGDWGTLWSGIALGVLVFSIPAGVLGDRFGVRRTIGAGVAVGGAALLLRAEVGGFAPMLASMVLYGVSVALVAANLPKTLGLWFPLQQLGFANGVTLAGFGAGQGAAILLTPFVVVHLGGWRELTQLFGYLSFAVAVYWLAVVREPSGTHGTSTGGSPLASLGKVLRVRDVRFVAVCYFLYFGGYLGAIGYVPTYFTTVQGMSPERTGFIVSLAAWTFIFGSILLPALSDRIGLRRRVFFGAIFANGIVVFAEAFLLGVPLALASILWGISAGAVGLLFVVPVEMERVGPALAGSAIGVANSAGFLGGAIAPVLGMSLVAVDPLMGFAFFTACYLLSASLFLTIRETGWRRRT
jgi:NNP family nitrate/nitrite transporter-like MFS transporter